MLYINTPGGSISAGLAIYDTMNYIRPDVSTTCVGLAASMGQLLLTGGADGKRIALPHSKILMHQPIGGTQGQATDIEIYTKEMLRTKESIFKIICEHTGKTLEQIMKDADRDNYMTAEEAKKYGLIDLILEKRTKPDKDKKENSK
jgi:ATP-dependent Clp protease protease subunit